MCKVLAAGCWLPHTVKGAIKQAKVHTHTHTHTEVAGCWLLFDGQPNQPTQPTNHPTNQLTKPSPTAHHAVGYIGDLRPVIFLHGSRAALTMI